jgi:hypothetical protein
MHIRPCILTLMIVYPLFLAAGVWFYRHLQKTAPRPLPDSDPRSKFIKPWRITVFVVLVPLATTLSLAVLGWLDPLFYKIASLY